MPDTKWSLNQLLIMKHRLYKVHLLLREAKDQITHLSVFIVLCFQHQRAQAVLVA